MKRLLINLAVYALRALPLKWSYKLAHLTGGILSLIPTRDRRIAELHLQKIVKHPDPKAIVLGMYRSLAYTLVEAFSIPQLLKSSETISVKNPEVLSRYLKYPHGKMILTAHYSNWELMAGFFIKTNPLRTSVIAKTTRNAVLREVLNQIRKSYGINVIDKDDKRGAYTILRYLKKGETIGVLLDQDTDVKSLFIPFFGRATKTPEAVIDAGLRTNAGIFVPFITRIAPFRFEFEIHELSNQKTKEELLLEYNQLLESKLREAPEQWIWFHKRWRSLPSGECPRTSEYIKYLESL